MMKYGLSENTIEKINSVFVSNSEVKNVLLYGSRAKGNYRVGSDIDLVIKESLPFNRLLSIENQLEELCLPYTIDVSIYDRIKNPDLLEHIKRIGKNFYERST